MDDGQEALVKSLKAGKVDVEVLTLDGLSRDSGLQPSDLEGHAVCIDYKDSDGDLSRRWISIHHVDADGPLIVGYCWKRRMSRTFRADRISSVMDMDGEVLLAKEFFAAFGIALAKKRPRKSTNLPVPEPATATAGGKYASQKPRKRKVSDQLPEWKKHLNDHVGKPPPSVHDDGGDASANTDLPEWKWVNHFPGPEWKNHLDRPAPVAKTADQISKEAERRGCAVVIAVAVVAALVIWII